MGKRKYKPLFPDLKELFSSPPGTTAYYVNEDRPISISAFSQYITMEAGRKGAKIETKTLILVDTKALNPTFDKILRVKVIQPTK